MKREPEVVIWHDIECGGYVEDLPLWRMLAEEADAVARARTDDPYHAHGILDVGAGTGRVSLDLAGRGHAVTALDMDAEQLTALAARAKRRRIKVETMTEDARAFSVSRRFALIIVPMQTLQLLGGRLGRAQFLACAREHLDAGGILAAAIANPGDGADDAHTEPPLPDMRDVGGVVYASRPVELLDDGERIGIRRLRETVDEKGRRTSEENLIWLDIVDAATIGAEADGLGFEALDPLWIPQTEEYVGSTVVMLRAV